jgi:hypothetical protein
MDKELNGKAIYSPKGKAGEYAKYAKTHEWMMDGMRVGMDASNL